MQNAITGTPAPTFVALAATVDNYRAATVRNHTWGINFRIEGAPGAPFTTSGLDADFFPSIDGGPGLYMMKVLMSSKNGSSSGYRAAFQEIGVHRIGDSGFM